MTRALLRLVIAGTLLASGCATAGIATDVPLADRAVQSPGPEVSKDLAAFSGRWAGVWTDGKSYRKNMALIIERVTAPDRATGFYACGHAQPRAHPACPSAMQVTGRLENGVLKIAYPAIRADGLFRVNGQSLEGRMVDWTTGRLLIWVTATRLP